MQFALVDGERVEAFPGGRGTCEICGNNALAKCGPRIMHHWAHAGRRDCDPWWENETEWHRAWKSHFPESCREVAYRDSSGEVHRADIVTPTGIVIEVQHSAMTDAERESREGFYKNLVWVIDGRGFRDNFYLCHMLPAPTSAIAADLVWSPAAHRMEGANAGIFFRLSEMRRDNPGREITKATRGFGWLHGIHRIKDQIDQAYCGHHQYVWVRPRRTWLDAHCPVYVDFGTDELLRLQTYDESGLACVFRVGKRKFLHDVMTETDATAIATRFYPIS